MAPAAFSWGVSRSWSLEFWCRRLRRATRCWRSARRSAGIGNSVFHPADFAILNARVSTPRLGYAFSAHGVVGYLGYAVAPVFSVSIGAAFGWQAALLTGAALGVGVLAVLIVNSRHLGIERQPSQKDLHPQRGERALHRPGGPLLRVLRRVCRGPRRPAELRRLGHRRAVPRGGDCGVERAHGLSRQPRRWASWPAGSSRRACRATTCRRRGHGGQCRWRSSSLRCRSFPGAALPAALAVAGFASGIVAPSRDLIVRASTPPGAAGRVFGFVYSGLDVGSLTMPVFYGWMLDHGVPHAVFYTVAAFTTIAMLTVLQLPGGREELPRTSPRSEYLFCPASAAAPASPCVAPGGPRDSTLRLAVFAACSDMSCTLCMPPAQASTWIWHAASR